MEFMNGPNTNCKKKKQWLNSAINRSMNFAQALCTYSKWRERKSTTKKTKEKNQLLFKSFSVDIEINGIIG